MSAGSTGDSNHCWLFTMVVHPDFPGLEVKVIAGDDEIPCKEYRFGDDKSESGTPVRYIEAKSGELFCVYVHVPASCYVQYDVSAKIEIDGKTLEGRRVRKDFGSSSGETFHFYGTLNQPNGSTDLLLREFRFSQPQPCKIENAWQP
jgi:hypothetical protein